MPRCRRRLEAPSGVCPAGALDICQPPAPPRLVRRQRTAPQKGVSTMAGFTRGLLVLSAVAALAVALATPSQSATLPTGFAETQVATGLAAPTAMTFSPDGRLFVTEQGGRLRVIKNGALLATPFLTVNVDSAG